MWNLIHVIIERELGACDDDKRNCREGCMERGNIGRPYHEEKSMITYF